MKTRIRPIARAGVFGSQSNTQIVSEQDLQEIYESFTAQDSSPITIGHVTEAAEPRLGSVVSLELKDGILYGIIEEQDELAKAVDAGFFPECSIGAKRSGETGKLYLHHLAYLGEEPAAIKSFKKNIKEKIQLDDSGVIHAFPAVWKITLSDMDEGVKKMNELDEAKKRIAELEAEVQKLTAELEKAKAGSNGSGEDFEKLKTENEELKRKLLAFQEKHPEDELSLSDSDPRTKMLLNELRKTKTASLMQAAKGKVPAAHLKDLEVLANGLTLSNELLLSDGKKASSIETLTAIFNAMADPVLGTEIVLSDPEAKSAGQGASYASSAAKLMGAL
ncbi:hypothetical protein [Treponema phagedenis]|uniref:hypothetical protein n=1 Tax=Treponema phagedenis TaxID=162 RepID=UPI0015828A2E|nr:hypothetical protein [Treponema phagedenis]NVP24925.1 hypothetical protein [Treponema phagedenis]NVP25228.1 hypothetical protein [Treponema phagedenis]NVP25428.1 hypothetical protein [Treponema phagedenis]NVP25578.1 hypothetical protein [Treponema phagedenis]QKS91485.1 hypothetical protein HPJ96_02060 [Treponema phagedenis]